jgi:Domain of unknown function (DUF4253)
VPAARPADVLALVGYNGTANGYSTPEVLSAVLRSWEDRSGAVLVEVGFDRIRMLAGPVLPRAPGSMTWTMLPRPMRHRYDPYRADSAMVTPSLVRKLR